jgi:predicted nucleotidyltransferase
MKYGLSTTTVERLQNTLLHYPEVEKAVLYGSRAMGTYRPGSDIDLTLCSDELNHTLLTQINNELDDLLLPYQIDLSLMASLSHPALLDHIRSVGVVLYAKSSAPLEAYSFKNQSE